MWGRCANVHGIVWPAAAACRSPNALRRGLADSRPLEVAGGDRRHGRNHRRATGAVSLLAVATVDRSPRPRAPRTSSSPRRVDFAGALTFIGIGRPRLRPRRGPRTARPPSPASARPRPARARRPTPTRSCASARSARCSAATCSRSLVADGEIALTDRLQDASRPRRRRAGEGRHARSALIDLVTQASGLPREVPRPTGRTAEDPFATNTGSAQIADAEGRSAASSPPAPARSIPTSASTCSAPRSPRPPASPTPSSSTSACSARAA